MYLHGESDEEDEKPRSLWIKPTDALNSNFIGTSITILHVSDSFSAHHQEFLAVHRLWYILCSVMMQAVVSYSW